MNLEAGTQLGEYRILSRIGRGAYGIVFEAEHSITRRIDAVKLMLDAGTSTAEDEQRFLREIQAQASLQHPNIATVYGAFRTEWGLALAMELVNGKSLRTILQGGRLDPVQAANYILPVLAGLSCAERLGVVHRDIKPDNILITSDGTVKLTDFGLAQVANAMRITTSGENLGTPCYMSPEQVVGEKPADARSDIYSTGVVLYEAVSGRPPFVASNGFAVMLAHQNTVPVPPMKLEPGISRHLNEVILKALEKDPARRFQTAAEFSAALERAIVPVAAVPGKPASSITGRVRVMGAAAGVTLAICGFGAWAGHVAASRRDPIPPAIIAKPVPAPQSPLPHTDAPPSPEAAAAPEEESEIPAPPRRIQRTAKPVSRQSTLSFAPPPGKASGSVAHVPAPDPVPPPPQAHVTPLQPATLELPTAITPPLAPESVAEPAPPKRRNIVKRALGRIFGHRPTDTERQPAASAIKP